jgi:exopolysaccharide biosynthesis polyprenyl glycosylphosphotransferase
MSRVATPSRSRRFASAVVALPFGGAETRGITEQAPVRRVARRESVYRRLLAAADVLSVTMALVLAFYVFGDDRLKPEPIVAIPLVVVVAKLQGLYERDGLVLNKTTLDEAPKLFQAATLYTLLISLGASHLVIGAVGAREAFGVWVLLFAFQVFGRAAMRRIAGRITAVERVVVIGSPEDSQRLETKLGMNTRVRAELVGRAAFAAGDDRFGDTLGTLNDLEAIVREHQVHRVIVAPHGTESALMLEAIRAAKAVGVHVSVLPRLLEVVGSSVEFDQLYGVTVMGVRRFGLSKSSAIIKRALDLLGATAGLALVAPVMLALALTVKRSSPGPVFFKQRRVGRDGEAFEVFKFRTMVDGADRRKGELLGSNEADGLFKIAEDPRVTPVGRFLRRSSLDELPQLFNVLRGEMSLVGPRPLVPEEDSRIEGRHRRRLHLKPGMTGQWQIFGSSKIPLREMVTIDYLYVANWSLWGDVKILCRTVPYVLARRGL